MNCVTVQLKKGLYPLTSSCLSELVCVNNILLSNENVYNNENFLNGFIASLFLEMVEGDLKM
jgi:hypothetical protein